MRSGAHLPLGALLLFGTLLGACTTGEGPESPATDAAVSGDVLPQTAASTVPTGTWPLHVPDVRDIPEGPEGEAIRRGRELATHTRDLLPENVGNGLNCTSCHLQGGTVADAGPWVGITGVFPQYRTRNARMNSLQERVDDCFERSMNGTPLPLESEEMTAIVAYMTWLSQGVPTGTSVEGRGFRHAETPPEPDPVHGAIVYAEKCASCHGSEGQGMDTPDGGYLFPALWGDKSFNIGAGMARLDTAASFVRWNMPLGQGGTLTEQEAYDVAAFFTAQPRPDFAGKSQDWPNGGKPHFARY